MPSLGGGSVAVTAITRRPVTGPRHSDPYYHHQSDSATAESGSVVSLLPLQDSESVMSAAYELVATSHARQSALGVCLSKWRACRGVVLRRRRYEAQSRMAAQFHECSIEQRFLSRWQRRAVVAKAQRVRVEAWQQRRNHCHLLRVLSAWANEAARSARRRDHTRRMSRSSGPAGPSPLALLFAGSASRVARVYYCRWRAQTARSMALRYLELRRTRQTSTTCLALWRTWAARSSLRQTSSSLLDEHLAFAQRRLALTAGFVELRLRTQCDPRVPVLRDSHAREMLLRDTLLPQLRRRLTLRRWRCEFNCSVMLRHRARRLQLCAITAWRARSIAWAWARTNAPALAQTITLQLGARYMTAWRQWARARRHFNGSLVARVMSRWLAYHRAHATQRALVTVSEDTVESLERDHGRLHVFDDVRYASVGIPVPPASQFPPGAHPTERAPAIPPLALVGRYEHTPHVGASPGQQHPPTVRGDAAAAAQYTSRDRRWSVAEVTPRTPKPAPRAPAGELPIAHAHSLEPSLLRRQPRPVPTIGGQRPSQAQAEREPAASACRRPVLSEAATPLTVSRPGGGPPCDRGVDLVQVQRAARLVVGLETHAVVLQQRVADDDAAVRRILAADVDEWAAKGSHFEATLADAGERRGLLAKVATRAADLRARYDLDDVIGAPPPNFGGAWEHRQSAKATAMAPVEESAVPFRQLPYL